MQLSKLPVPTYLNKIEPGSLVMLPGENVWAIRSTLDNLFIIDSRRTKDPNGLLQNFGKNYRVSVDPYECRCFFYDWDDDGPPDGSLCLFPGQESYLMVTGANRGELMYILDLKTGVPGSKSEDDGEVLLYSRWKLELLCTDEADSYQIVHQFGTK